MGLSNEKHRKIMEMEREMENNPSMVNPLYNWGPCKCSKYCPAMQTRLDFLPEINKKRQKFCSNNPGIEECRMYQFFQNTGKKYDISSRSFDVLTGSYDSLCKVIDNVSEEVRDRVLSFRWDMRVLSVDIKENGWK